MEQKNQYQPQEIESKWQQFWLKEKVYQVDLKKAKNKFYCLTMFIYPSADKLHIGHWYNYGPADSFARFKKMQGFDVFSPIGYDAFGLPAENYAIKKGVRPKASTDENIKYIRQQLKAIGAIYDWDYEINTSEPEYYRWTQWVFLQLYKKGLAYREKAKVNWCPSCQTVLANEQVKEGLCERCDSKVVQKEMTQWFFKITKYAEELLNHQGLDWPAKSIAMQKNWIGRSEGALIKFKVKSQNSKVKSLGIQDDVEVFTTRPDTIFGATYLVVAPEHPLVVRCLSLVANRNEVENYLAKSQKKSELERTELAKEKTGVELKGIKAINPANQKEIPVWVADYVVMSYGTGAIMAVPAHDKRDFAFAKKYQLPIVEVIKPEGQPTEDCYPGEGIMINSGQFDGLDSIKAKAEITKFVGGQKKINYKLHDWLISRQRYWGAPIPIIYCPRCGEVAVSEKDLPVRLPEEVDFKPTGESPLARSKKFVETNCPKCGGLARREVDTMDTFVCSSWYYLRYLSPHDDQKPFDKKLVARWLPVDMYVGGAEHVTMHLIYARFIAKVLMADKNYEPFKALRHQGTITKNGAKMSKSRGNVVIPDQFIKKYGSDCFRMFLMFMGPYEEGGDWHDQGILGIKRFLERIWNAFNNEAGQSQTVASSKSDYLLHQTIKKVAEDLENFRFNTAISQLMIFFNGIDWRPKLNSKGELEADEFDKSALESFLKLLAPLAPHLVEELWQKLGHQDSIFKEKWPVYDPRMIRTEEVEIVIQVNGKLRDTIKVATDSGEAKVKEMALNSQKVKIHLKGEPKKVIFVKNKLINFVI